jgi:anti-sigma factor RsiW
MDRRRVERHLIGCPQCRQRQVALGQSLETLRSVAATTPAHYDTPSLWPALARQIRESHRLSPTPVLAFPSPLPLVLSWFRLNPWPAVGFGLALLVAVTAAIQFGARQRNDAVKDQVVAITRPIAPVPMPPRTMQTTTPVSDPRRELSPTSEPAPAETRHDYYLERGRPMPPDRGDPRLTY